MARSIDDAFAAQDLAVLDGVHLVSGIGKGMERLATLKLGHLSVKRHTKPAREHHHDLLLGMLVWVGPLTRFETKPANLYGLAGEQFAIGC